MASKKVLIVDDEDNIGRSLQMILEREGYAVTICRSLAEFRAKPEATRVDAYLFDMRLPDGSGIDLLRSVQQNDGRAPAIMISFESLCSGTDCESELRRHPHGVARD
jgi:DNA-binding NtrC family response regulator